MTRRTLCVALGDEEVRGRIDPKTGDLWTNINGRNVLVPLPATAQLAPATNPHNVQPRVIPPKAKRSRRAKASRFRA